MSGNLTWKARGITAVMLGGGMLLWVGCGGDDNGAAPGQSPPTVGNSTAASTDPTALLAVGTSAPVFSLPDQAGKAVNLASFQGQQNVVLIFYPGDDTPGCTKQLCAVRDDYSQFKAAGVAIFGINPQGADSHRRFIEKHQLPFPLLVDQDKQVVAAYGCRGTFFTTRTVHGIDKAGQIVFAQRGMPANSAILEAFK